MNKLALAAAAITLTLLSACAGDASTGFFGISLGSDRVWYDGFYGPYPGGYWRRDMFNYPDGHGIYRQDDGGHFRRQRFDQSQEFKPTKPPADVSAE